MCWGLGGGIEAREKGMKPNCMPFSMALLLLVSLNPKLADKHGQNNTACNHYHRKSLQNTTIAILLSFRSLPQRPMHPQLLVTLPA